MSEPGTSPERRISGQRRVYLRSAGAVTLEYDLNLAALSPADRETVRRIFDHLRQYEDLLMEDAQAVWLEANQPSAAPQAESEEG